MKNLTSLLLAGTFCFVGIGLTGCSGSEENTVIEQTADTGDTGGFESQEQMDQYAAEMQQAMQQGQGQGQGQ